MSRHWHRDGEDRALNVANALIHHPNIEPSVERSHCLQQANTQEEQMEGEDGAEPVYFSRLSLWECVSFVVGYIATICFFYYYYYF